jgi:hypothetical protein
VPILVPTALVAAYGRNIPAPFSRLRFTLTGATPVVVGPLEGDLTWDASRWPRCELRATLPTTITPTNLPAALSAYGGRVTVTSGARVAGREHTFTAATLYVAQVDIDRPDARIEVLATSGEAIVNEDRYDTPTNTAAGQLRDVVAGIVRRSIPDVVVVDELGTVGATDLPEGAYVLDGDVWPVVERIMDDHGAEAWFDNLGRLVLRLVPVVKTTPDLTIKVGGDGGTLTGYASERRWGPNRVALVYSTERYEGRTRHLWSTATGAPTTLSGRVNANAAPGAATELYVHTSDLNGTNVADQFAGIRAGDTVRLVDDASSLKKPSRVVYEVTGPATLASSVLTIPVKVVRAVRHPDSPALFPGGTELDVYVRIKPRRRVGTWEDTVATSPTRITGPYGRHTYREDLPVERGELPSQTEADAAALAMARRVVGRLRGLTVRAVSAPWLLPGDSVRLTMLGALTETHVVQAVTHPLSGLDVMELTTRDAAYTGGPF